MPDSLQIKHDIMVKLAQAQKQYKCLCDRVITGAGIYLSQNNLLRTIAERSPIAQNELPGILGVSNATVAVSLQKIEAKGWVYKYTDRSDSRCNIVEITAEGLRVHRRCNELCGAFNEQVWDSFSPDELDEFERLLDRLLASLDRLSGAETE